VNDDVAKQKPWLRVWSLDFAGIDELTWVREFPHFK
jgi:hypothetical protein